MKNSVAAILGASFLVLATPARADGQTEEYATVLHAAPGSLRGGKQYVMKAQVNQDWQLDRLWLAVRPLGSGDPFQTINFRRDSDRSFGAVLPAALVQPPGLEYYIASQDREGHQSVHFASAKDPKPLLVDGETPETLIAERLSGHRGHRSSFDLTTEATIYGPRLAQPGTATDEWSDRYWTAELEYTYRFLRTLYDIRFGLGVLRGHRATAIIDGQEVPIDKPTAQEEPGLNYGWGETNFALHRNFSAGLRLTLGASEEGFAAGFGGS